MNTLTVCLIVLFIVLLLACFVAYLRKRSRLLMESLSDNRRVRIVCINEDDGDTEVDEGEWASIPSPDKIASHGLDHIGGYVERLIQSSSPQSGLIISSPD